MTTPFKQNDTGLDPSKIELTADPAEAQRISMHMLQRPTRHSSAGIAFWVLAGVKMSARPPVMKSGASHFTSQWLRERFEQQFEILEDKGGGVCLLITRGDCDSGVLDDLEPTR